MIDLLEVLQTAVTSKDRRKGSDKELYSKISSLDEHMIYKLLMKRLEETDNEYRLRIDTIDTLAYNMLGIYLNDEDEEGIGGLERKFDRGDDYHCLNGLLESEMWIIADKLTTISYICYKMCNCKGIYDFIECLYTDYVAKIIAFDPVFMINIMNNCTTVKCSDDFINDCYYFRKYIPSSEHKLLLIQFMIHFNMYYFDENNYNDETYLFSALNEPYFDINKMYICDVDYSKFGIMKHLASYIKAGHSNEWLYITDITSILGYIVEQCNYHARTIKWIHDKEAKELTGSKLKNWTDLCNNVIARSAWGRRKFALCRV